MNTKLFWKTYLTDYKYFIMNVLSLGAFVLLWALIKGNPPWKFMIVCTVVFDPLNYYLLKRVQKNKS
jgi:hypothetical protein